VSATDEGLVTHRTFFSYLHMCESEDETPSERAYADAEAYFDAELRAITAHVLFPVGERATRHVFAQYTAREPGQVDMAALHTEEIRGAGWLVVPVADPVGWSDDEADRLAERATRLLDRDYRQQSDLGRFLAGNDPYFVR